MSSAQHSSTKALPDLDSHTITISDSNSDSSSAYYTPPSPTSTMSSTTTTSSKAAIPTHRHQPPTSATASGAANISLREYIYFLPYPLPKNTPIPYSLNLDLPNRNPLNLPTTKFEPTSTLVLTSPNRTFVDLRFYKPISPLDTPLPNNADRSRLEWGFAGTSNSTPCTDPYVLPGGKPFRDVSLSTWMHWIDSRHEVGSSEIPVDKGHMYPLSPTHTLEVGDMWHPDIGEHKGHEEMWRDEDILPVTMLSTHLPDSTKETTTTNTTLATTGRKDCIVLRLHSPTNSVRGVVIRVGQYIQGIVMKGRYSSVERWEWKDTEGWKRTARIGDQFLPCMVTAREDVLNVGGRVRYFDYEWVVEEVWRWE